MAHHTLCWLSDASNPLNDSEIEEHFVAVYDNRQVPAVG